MKANAGEQNPDNAAKRAALRAALAVGIAELDAGLGKETTVEELMAEVLQEAGHDG
jgi:hypothetical protein